MRFIFAMKFNWVNINWTVYHNREYKIKNKIMHAYSYLVADKGTVLCRAHKKGLPNQTTFKLNRR